MEAEEEASEEAAVAEDMVVVVEDIVMVRLSSTWYLLFEWIHTKSLKEYNVEKDIIHTLTTLFS